MLQSNPKREIPNFEERRIREKEFMVQRRDLLPIDYWDQNRVLCYIVYVGTVYNIRYIIYDILYTVYYIRYIIYGILYTVYYIPCI